MQARTEKGVSVREAADATRLRADVIENMESGAFDYKLPEIYKRGFLRIYAAYLRLNVDEILAEYAAELSRGNFEDAKRRNILSRVATAAASATANVAAGQREFTPPPASVESRFENFDRQESEAESETPDNSSKFIKLAAIFGGVILLVVVIVLIVSSAVSRNAPEENPDVQINANMPTQPAAPVSQATAAASNDIAHPELVLAITALSDTYILVYPDIKTPDGKPADAIYTGPLQAGERREFRSVVPLMVKLTDAERVKIERNGAALDLKGAKGLNLFRVHSK